MAHSDVTVSIEQSSDDESSINQPLLTPGSNSGSNPLNNSGTFLPDLQSALRSLHENLAANAQPPAYRSLCDIARAAKTTSTGFFSFLKIFYLEVYWALTCNVVVTRVFVVVPMIMIAVGGIYWHECPIQPYIPIYLVAAGSSAVLSFVLVGTHSALYSHDVATSRVHETPTCLIATELIVFTFQLAWFIAGCVWIYSIYEPKYHSPGEYCGQFIYLFAFWVNNVTLIILVITFLCSSLFGVCMYRCT